MSAYVRRATLLAFAACLARPVPAAAQMSWGVAVNAAQQMVFCDLRRDRVWKLDRTGTLTVVLPETHCHGLALAPDGFIYGESVSAGSHIDISSGANRDSALGVWRLGVSGVPAWIEPPTSMPDASIWFAIDREGRSYGWNGSLPHSTLSQIVRREPLTATARSIAGSAWGRRDGLADEAQLGRVAGLAVAADGSLLIADSGAIRRLTLLGQLRTESAGAISDPESGVVGRVGLWDRSIGLASDSLGGAVVVDYPRGRVVHVGRDGRASEMWRSRGWMNALTGSRWGWRPTGVAVLPSGFYVMEDWAMPPLAADLIGVPRVLFVRPDGSSETVVRVASWFLRALTLLLVLIAVSAAQAWRKRR